MSVAYAPASWPHAARAPRLWRFAAESQGEGGACRVEWLLKRNCSMSPAQLFGVYLSLASVSLVIALGFTWHGASPVLAFAGIELLLVGLALVVYARHAGDHERITLVGATLSVAHQRGAETDRRAFRAAWVRVEPLSSDRSLIELTGDGQTAHVGRYLRPELRQPLAQELRLALRSQPRGTRFVLSPGTRSKVTTMIGMTSQRLARAALPLSAALASTAALAVNNLPGGPAVNQLDLHPPVTKIAAELQWLHYYIMIICIVIFIAVFGVMFYSILKHRKSQGAKAANFHESVAVEIAWTVVPFFIVIGMALPATKAVVAMKDTTNADITIKATGYQWKWGYDYLKGEGEGINFLSTLDVTHREMSDSGKPPATDDFLLKVDNPMVVPVDKKVRIITTANDVIHAWMVPSFGVKQDAIPGFVRDAWFRAEKTGDFYGQCAELCGKEHAYMPIHVKVLSQADYSKWVAERVKAMQAAADDPAKVWQLADLVARGEKVYAANCVACHKADGKGDANAKIKALDGSEVVLGEPGRQIQILLNGAANGAMPAWKQLSDTDLAAVATYTKNSWSNKTGKLVQPAELVAARK